MKKENAQVEVAKNKPGVLKRVVSIVMLAVIAILAISSLALAVIPKDYNFGLSDPTCIKIYTSNESINNTRWYKDSNDGVYEKVMELYNNSFKTTLLNALFKGAMFESVSPEEGTIYFNDVPGDKIEFIYNEKQTVKINGVKYQTSNSSIYDEYVSVIIAVNNSNSLEKVTAYIRHGGENSTIEYSKLRFNSYAVQAELHEYINSL